jgi:hypothetical protein
MSRERDSATSFVDDLGIKGVRPMIEMLVEELTIITECLPDSYDHMPISMPIIKGVLQAIQHGDLEIASNGIDALTDLALQLPVGSGVDVTTMDTSRQLHLTVLDGEIIAGSYAEAHLATNADTTVFSQRRVSVA